MKLKIKILVALFGVKAAIYLVNGAVALTGGASYAEYGDAFVNMAIMGYIAYAIYATRNKWTYWLAVFFSGLTLLQTIAGAGLIYYSNTSLPAELIVFGILNTVIFGATPLLLLVNKEIRNVFLYKPK